MSCSPAQLAANLQNSKRSTGPRTAAGKCRSRANGLKHGLSGAGVVIAPEDAAVIDARIAEFEDDLKPNRGIARALTIRAALLSLRMERCALQEIIAVRRNVVHAREAFDEARLAKIDHALDWLRAEPATHCRALRSMPEGIDKMIERLMATSEELNTGRWSFSHGDQICSLMGTRFEDIPIPRARALSEAILGRFDDLWPEDGGHLSQEDRINWARQAMADLIDAECRKLRALQATIDRDAIEHDRAAAPSLALFDSSRDTILARRYEATASREFFKTLDAIEEANKRPPTAEPAETLDPNPGEAEVSDELASCCMAASPARPESRKNKYKPIRPISGAAVKADSTGRRPGDR